jgi:hypothetical protein
MTQAPDPNDAFNALIAGFGDVAPPEEVVDYSKWSLVELDNELVEIDNQLTAVGELMQPKTEYGRTLHSKRAAIVINKHKRMAE